MCFKFKYNPTPQPLPGQPPVKARINETESAPLPKAKEVVRPEEVKSVQYGSTKKQGGAAAAKKTGAAALRIPLNTAGASGGTPNV